MGPNYIQVPAIILKGQWLKAAGFEAGDYVEVNCVGDKIILSKTTAPEVIEKESLEAKVHKLDKKQRAKLAKLIDEL